MKRLAILGALNLVVNIAVWDGVSPWEPISYSVDITNKSVRFNQAQHYRPEGAVYHYNIVIDGNSHSDESYTQGHSARMGFQISEAYTNDYEWISQATSGYTTPVLLGRASNYIDPLYDSSLGVGKHILIFWEGTNAIASDAAMTANQAYADIKSYCQARKASGDWKIIVGTIMSRTASLSNANYESIRVSVNQMIRDALQNGETWLDDIADVGGDPHLGQGVTATYFVGGLHLTNAGMDVAKIYFRDAINRIK